MAKPKVSIPVPEELAEQLPADPQERQQVLIWGLREWRVHKALQAYRRGRAPWPMPPGRRGSLSAR